MKGNGEKTVLIMGGRGKNAPYAPLIGLIESTVKLVVLIGEDADNIASQLDSHVEMARAADMSEAVAMGFDAAGSGDNVLLAPACASFDMFKSFEDRGKVFKSEVMRLTAKPLAHDA
jgi:UDP-N-acetylmuramoylalanine--D-glutamate ligase